MVNLWENLPVVTLSEAKKDLLLTCPSPRSA
jgi:hypothetical protein